MSLPLAHACVGGSIGVALWPERTAAGLKRALWVGALLGVLPDVDIVLGRTPGLGAGWHHGFTHSVVFALVAGAVAARLCFGGWRHGRGLLVCVLAALSHLALDFVMTETRGLALLWPVTDHRYRLGIPALSYYRFASLSLGARMIGELLVIESILFIPLLAITLSVCWRGVRRRARNAAGRAGVDAG
jgi:membrane-bound metal-dependent hydrolase YbcI (DUF457 family)